MEVFGRWGDTPIGAGLAAEDSGLTLTALGAISLSRLARSSFSLSDGIHGYEVCFWGDDPQTATIGVCNGFASLANELGTANGGIGWRLHAGQVVRNNVVVASGLPIPQKGEAVGVRLIIEATSKVEFYMGSTAVAQLEVGSAGPFYFAASIAMTTARGLRCIVNAGQWQGLTPASAAGWVDNAKPFGSIRLGSEDYMSHPTDAAANVAYQGLLTEDGISTVASVAFWMWANDSRPGAAQLRVHDAAGILDAVALTSIRDAPVSIRQVPQGGSLDASVAVARYVLDRVEVEDDSAKLLILKDAHSDLDRSLHRSVFLPSQGESSAWQPHPVIIGLVRSAPGISVNSDGSLRWLCDSRLLQVLEVRDRAAELDAGTAYTLAASGQQLVLKSPALGPLTADVSTLANGGPATLSQALYDVFSRIGKSAWSVADAQAIDQVTGYTGVGFYAGEGSTAREALSAILPSYAVDWWQDGDGVLRLARLVNPDTVADPALDFDLDLTELTADLVVLPDLAPNLSRRMTYRANAASLAESDMVTNVDLVPPSLRKELGGAYRGQVYAAGELATCYQHADSAAAMVSCFDLQKDAQAEIDRIVAIYGTPRFFYAGRMGGRIDLHLRPGQVGRIRYPRYGLSAGRKVIVAGVSSNPITGEQALKFWGA